MKVLIINTSVSQGGAALSALNIQETVADLGIDTWMLSARDAQCLERKLLSLNESESRLRVNALAYRLLGVDGFANRVLWKKILPRLKEFDLIHLHNVHGYYMPLDVLQVILSRPCVWTLHDFWIVTGGPGFPPPPFENRRGVERFFPFVNFRYPAELIDRSRKRRRLLFALIREHQPSLVAVSHAMAGRLKSMGLHQANMTVIQHGLYDGDPAPSATERERTRQKKGWPMDRHVFLFTSAQVDNPVKGCDLFIRALNGLSTEIPWVAYVVGDKSEVARKKVEELGLDVRFLGKVSESEMGELFCACDTYVTPTLDETFGRTVVEALAEGPKVVCTDLPVLREVSGGHAIYFPPGDVATLCKEMLTVLQGSMTEDRHNIANEIRSRFSRMRMAQKYVSTYQAEIEKSERSNGNSD